MKALELTAEPILKANALLGEGSIWNQEMGVLHWVDIDGFKIHTYDPRTGEDTSIPTGTHVGTVVNRTRGGFVASLPGKFVAFDEAGAMSVLATIDEDKQIRMNDGKCDPAGRFWCGSMHFEYTEGAGSLYMMDTNLNVQRKLDNITISNGIVWNSDATIMYYIDTGTGHIDAFDFELATGEIQNRRIVYKHEKKGYLDGMTIDTDDNLYVATWEGNAVYKIDPRKGVVLSVIRVPGAERVTSCAFGGDQLSDLYITSASVGTNPQEEPNAGSLFRVRIDDAKGIPAYKFAG
ncbi:MAG: SMP-30/gluconolactonase/LRE family protein [Candidatus Obscuribacterales bacterium]|nr:SMP-30/gluconolactonase/LRE family protein [Candidatus Obscuribacterales bacterium]